jgi:hypothetical protein
MDDALAERLALRQRSSADPGLPVLAGVRGRLDGPAADA